MGALRKFCCTCAFMLLCSVLNYSTGAKKTPKRGHKATTAEISGCAEYKTNSICAKCKAGYQLASGSCSCALGYVQVGTDCKPGPCHRQCGKTYMISANGGVCHCDYFCNDHGDCCGGAASKDALCPHMAPTKNKKRLTDDKSSINKQTRSIAAVREGKHQYLPGMCWCDEHCKAAGDCCARCSSSTSSTGKSKGSSSGSSKGGRERFTMPGAAAAVGISSLPAAAVSTVLLSNATASSNDAVQAAQPGDIGADINQADLAAGAAAVTADSKSALAQQVAAEAAAAAAKNGGKVSDCGAQHVFLGQGSAGNHSAVSIASGGATFAVVQAEIKMQQCQAADKGPPTTPYTIPIHWTAGQVCRNGICTGGQYSAANVRQQIAHVNAIYARVGIQFSWDGIIHTASASSITDIEICSDSAGRCWICQQTRYGDQVALNVITTPTHIGGTSLGVTIYPAYIVAGQVPPCANWVYIYEMLRHTWYEAQETMHPTVGAQCQASASQNPYDIVAGKSDGVRDTPAQSLNGSATMFQNSDILRFVNCDKRTGAYGNKTANAQQSCTAKVGFPDGDNYYNNFGNLMSYGDKTCLRTLTPGQGARVRCGLKCMRQGLC